MCAEPFRLRYIRKYHGEELGSEYAIKKTTFNENKRIMIWAAISGDGPEVLEFI